MKEKDEILISKVNEMIIEFNREDKTVWGSMFQNQHLLAQKKNEKISSFYSGAQAIRLYALWIFGCLFCCPLQADVLMTTQMTTRTQERMKRRFEANGRGGCRIGCALGIARLVHKWSKGLFRHLKKRGNSTIIWVVNEKEDLEEIVNQFQPYLDGVMTDKPTNLAEFASSYKDN